MDPLTPSASREQLMGRWLEWILGVLDYVSLINQTIVEREQLMGRRLEWTLGHLQRPRLVKQ